jgi:hypothetical protein
MNIQDLGAHLASLGVPADGYSIGADRNESYVLLFEDPAWKLYYSDRGARNAEAVVLDEDRACREFVAMVTGDRSVQEHMVRGSNAG